MRRLWAPGAATGIGSLPDTDPVEAAKLVFGELPLLPHIPELPARGAGADMIGRTAALLVDLPVQVVPTGWRLASHEGRDLRRAKDLLAWDLDATEAAATAYSGPLKLQVAGPWTLAACLELPTGHRVVSDHGATRDLAQSLADGLRTHLDEVRRRVPGASLVVQVDEPSLPSVLAGTVPTASGWGTLRAVERAIVRDVLRDLLAVAPEGGRVVHCCATDVPVALLREAAVDALSFDLTLVQDRLNDELGGAVDAGVALWPGVLPTPDMPIALEAAQALIERLWSELGFPREHLADVVVPTPACGLAGASRVHARRTLAVLHELTGWLRQHPGE